MKEILHKICCRCKSICKKHSSGRYFPEFRAKHGLMCREDKTLFCIFEGDRDRMEQRLEDAINLHGEIAKERDDLKEQIEHLKTALARVHSNIVCYNSAVDEKRCGYCDSCVILDIIEGK